MNAEEIRKRRLQTSLLTEEEVLERLCSWAIENGFATGHADSIEDLLGGLAWQIEELRQRKASS